MFYSNQILNRKAPLGIIWMAAHMDKKLKRNELNDTNVVLTIETIANPEAPLALRLSGHLLLGVVKVHSRQTGYILQDCNDALHKLQQAVGKAAEHLVLPEASAAPHTITLQDPVFALADFRPPEQQVLEQFETNFDDALFELPATGEGRHSMTYVDDQSLFASQPSIEEERFEVAEADLDLTPHLAGRPSDAATPEVAREAAGPEPAGPLLDTLEGGAEATPAGAAGPNATPKPRKATAPVRPSTGGLTDQPDDAPFPREPSFDPPPFMPDEVPLFDGGDAHVGPLDEDPDSAKRAPELTPEPAAPAGLKKPGAGSPKKHKKRRRLLVDQDEGGGPATSLSASTLRALINDPSSLIRPTYFCSRAARRKQAALALRPLTAEGLLERSWLPLPAAAPTALAPGPAAEPSARPGPAQAEATGEAPREAEAEAAGTPPPPAHTQAPPASALGAAPEAGGPFPDDDRPPDYIPDMNMEALPEASPLGALVQFSAASLAEETAGPDSQEEVAGDQGAPRGAAGSGAEEDADGGAAAGGAAGGALTQRSRRLARDLQRAFGAEGGAKRRRTGKAGRAAGGTRAALPLTELLGGQPRLRAVQTFFELLVLKTRSCVELEQEEPYQEIFIRAQPELQDL